MAHLTARTGRASARRRAKDGGRRSTTSPAIRRRRRWLAVGALAAAGLGMTGCRGGDQSTESTIAVRCTETRRSPLPPYGQSSTVFDGTVVVRMRAPSWTDADEDFRVALEHVALQGDLDFTPNSSAAPIVLSGAEWADRPGEEFDPHLLPFLVDPGDGSSLSPSPLLHVPGTGAGAVTLALQQFGTGAGGFLGPSVICVPAEGADATVATIPIHAAGD